MIHSVTGTNLQQLLSAQSSSVRGAEDSNTFAKLMMDSLEHVNQMQQQAEHAVELLATGEEVHTAEVLTSIQKADLSFRLMLQIRNKLMQAYQEINQIRI